MSTSRIKELSSNIMKARSAYYNGSSKISDNAFDALVDELYALDPKNPAVIGIGAEPASNWEKYTHTVPMGSLNKAQTKEEFTQWHSKYVGKDDEFFVTLKLDGLSVSLIYEDGKLSRAVTRGSGTVGEVITQNVAKMMGVPLRISKNISAIIRGEILLSKNNHSKFFEDYSNTRNAASGISRRFDSEGADKLSVLVYNVVTNDVDFKTHKEQFEFLESLKFNVPTYSVLKSADSVWDLKDKYQSDLRDKYAFDLDGLVVHNNDLAKHDAFGASNDRPRGSLAIKFASIHKEAFIKDIIVQVGNSGRLTPVAIFDPKVNLMGADVERASLHNFSMIQELGVGIGATVLVCRSNDVIPFITETVKQPSNVFAAPKKCPECDTPVKYNGEYVECPNFDCKAQVAGRVKNWIKNLNILEFGETLIEKLVESGKVKDIGDLYTLSVKDIANLDRMGEKSAQNCYNSLWETTEIPLYLLLGSLSIPLIGRSSIKLLVESGYDTLDKIKDLTLSELASVHGLGPAKSQAIILGIKSQYKLIDKILKNGITIKKKIVGGLSNKSFVFTGAMVNKRAELEKMVVDAGGIIKSSVGKDVTYLVIADTSSTSSKAEKARKLGTKLISEDEFLGLVK